MADKGAGMGLFGWLAVVAILGVLNVAFFGILYLGLFSTGILDFIMPPASNWEQIQTQVSVSLPASGTSEPMSLAHAAKYLRSTPTSTPFRPPSPTPIPPTPIPTKPVESSSTNPSPMASTIVKVQGITAHKPSMPLYNEARTAVDWAAFFGITIDEKEFQKKLPKSDDPESGFVGDPSDAWGQIPPQSYGVYATPLVKALESYGVKARSRKNMLLEELLTQIKANKPVIAWVKGNMETGNSVIYTTENGKLVTVTPYQHAVLVIGYDMGADPPTIIVLNNGVEETHHLDTFLSSWLVLGNMAITVPG